MNYDVTQLAEELRSRTHASREQCERMARAVLESDWLLDRDLEQRERGRRERNEA